MKAFCIVGLLAILAILIANSPAGKTAGAAIEPIVTAAGDEIVLSRRELKACVNSVFEAWKR